MSIESTKNAMDNYLKKQMSKANKSIGRTRKNNSPEKDVETECLLWLRSSGFSMTVIESKSVYSAKANRYLTGMVASGFPDLIGCDKHGFLVAIELKAKGELSTLRFKQRIFLMDKINSNCFAVCVDRVTSLQVYYVEWIKLRRENEKLSREYLLSILPKTKDEGKDLAFK